MKVNPLHKSAHTHTYHHGAVCINMWFVVISSLTGLYIYHTSCRALSVSSYFLSPRQLFSSVIRAGSSVSASLCAVLCVTLYNCSVWTPPSFSTMVFFLCTLSTLIQKVTLKGEQLTTDMEICMPETFTRNGTFVIHNSAGWKKQTLVQHCLHTIHRSIYVTCVS